MSSLYPKIWLKITDSFPTKMDKNQIFSILVRNFCPCILSLGCLQQEKIKVWTWKHEILLFQPFQFWDKFCSFFGHWNVILAINGPYLLVQNQIVQKRMRIYMRIIENTKEKVSRTLWKWRNCAPSEALCAPPLNAIFPLLRFLNTSLMWFT